MQGQYGNTKANTKTCVEFKYITKNITYEIYFDDDTNMTKNIRHHTQSDIKLNSNCVPSSSIYIPNDKLANGNGDQKK